MKKQCYVLIALVVLLFSAFPALSQDGSPYVYAWAQVEGESTIYVSDRVVQAETASGDRTARERWESALQRHGASRTSYRFVGMSRVIRDFSTADGVRREFLDDERAQGKQVVIVRW